ncbi:hypothetical protein [Streptomyces sp. AC495_CC817]|uniref:hypothetical protein n=1 Tax=Streptomyces sp. AC495_CC817 TaxID=2823900 RepID=UPI001C25C805|nr:hypothetical protein [Streptomyces sp. AC495_CC817]
MNASAPALQDDPRLIRLSDDVYVFGTYPYSGLVVTDDGCLAIDGPMSPRLSAQWKEFIASKGELRYQVYCEHHSDHAVSAPILQPEVLIASETTAAGLDTDEAAREAMRTWGFYPDTDPAFIDAYEMRRPDLTYRGRLNLVLGGKRFTLFEAPGHTMGSTVVHAVDDRVAFIADTGTTPAIQSGNPVSWLTTIALLETLDVDWYVQGHSDPLRRDDLHYWRTKLLAALDQARADAAAGVTPREIAERGGVLSVAELMQVPFVGRDDMPPRLRDAAGAQLQEWGADRMFEAVGVHPTDAPGAALGPALREIV